MQDKRVHGEKEQVRALALGIHQFLEELTQRFSDRTELDQVPQSELNLAQPVEAEFKVGQMGLGYDSDQDLVVVVAQSLQVEDEPEENAITARFWVTRGQAKAMADHALEVASQGRPMCALCGRPISPEGHFCPKRNGHTKDLVVQLQLDCHFA